MTYVAVWVDDMIIAATSNSLMSDIKELLKSKFKMTDLGMIKWFLGIEFDQTDTGISICQSHYLRHSRTIRNARLQAENDSVRAETRQL